MRSKREKKPVERHCWLAMLQYGSVLAAGHSMEVFRSRHEFILQRSMLLLLLKIAISMKW